MRKNLLTCMVGFVCFLGVNAQIQFEHSFDNFGIGMDGENHHWMTDCSFISETYGLLLGDFNKPNHSLDLYKADYTLFKSISLAPFFPNNVEEVYIRIISEKLFDPDNAIEFLVEVTDENWNSSLMLCKDNGTVMKDFGDAWPCLVYGCDVYKLAIHNYENNTIDYYSLPGTLPACYGGTLRSSNTQSNGFMAYPNPTKMNINVPYSLDAGENATLSIYTQSGALKEQKTISGTGTARINVSRYAPGVYIYKYNDVSGQFIVR